MSSRVGPVLYIAGVSSVLLVCAVAAHVGSLWLVFPTVFVVSMALTGFMSRRWRRERFRERPVDLHQGLIIAGVGLALNQLLFGPSSLRLSESLAAHWLSPAYVESVRALPVALTLPLALLAYEGLGYLLHRLSHTWGPLWDRVHSAHHEPEHFGVALSLRLSYVEFFVYQMTRGVLVQFTQIDPAVCATVMALSMYGIVTSHANTSLRFGWISRYFNTPEVHVWHHDAALRVNYSSGILMLFDRIANTYHCADADPARLGVSGITRIRSGLEVLLLRPLHQAPESSPVVVDSPE